MILGTANFNWEYNRSFISEKDCYKVLDYYYDNGGRKIDTAVNYHGNKIISDWIKKNNINNIEILSKIRTEDEIEKIFDFYNQELIHCIHSRENDKNLLSILHEYKKKDIIKNVGLSIYYPNETNQLANIYFIPADILWIKYLDTMTLHASIYIRSFFNMNDKNKEDALKSYLFFKAHERKDLNHNIEAVIGASNINQLKEDMELFK